MKKSVTTIILFLLLLVGSYEAWSCPPPTLSFRELVTSSDLIVSVQLNQLNPTDKRQFTFHKVLKGTYSGNTLKGYTPWRLRRPSNENEAVYALAFMRKSEKNDEYYTVSADNSVLLFSNMNDANFIIERFKKLIAIQEITNPNQHDHQLLKWLTNNMEQGESKKNDAFNRRGLITNKSSLFSDALHDLSDWKLDHEEKESYYKEEDLSWGGNLSLMLEEDQKRILQVYRKMQHPSGNFSRLVVRLGFTEVYPIIFNELYYNLAQDYRAAYQYENILSEMELPKQEQEYLAKLILFNYKARLLPYFKKYNTLYWYGGQNISYLSDFIQNDRLTSLVEDWETHLANREYRDPYNIDLFEQILTEAETHLNMCDDPRISELTGKKNLWTCVEESAFAKAEAFEEGSIESTIYPNPSNGNFEVKLKLEKEAPVHMDLESLDGKNIISSTLTSESADISHFYFQQHLQLEGLQSGLYLLTIRQQNKVFTEKVVIR